MALGLAIAAIFCTVAAVILWDLRVQWSRELKEHSESLKEAIATLWDLQNSMAEWKAEACRNEEKYAELFEMLNARHAAITVEAELARSESPQPSDRVPMTQSNPTQHQLPPYLELIDSIPDPQPAPTPEEQARIEEIRQLCQNSPNWNDPERIERMLAYLKQVNPGQPEIWYYEGILEQYYRDINGV